MSELNAILQDVASEVFENLAFIFPAFEPEDPVADEPTVTACIGFTGPFDGGIVLSISAGLLPVIAANMLGLDDETPTETQQEDAFRELLNVLCGNLLTRVAGEEAVFNVGRAVRCPDGGIPESISRHGALATACLDLEGGKARVTLFAPREALALADSHP